MTDHDTTQSCTHTSDGSICPKCRGADPEFEARRAKVLDEFWEAQNAELIAGALVSVACGLQIGKDKAVPKAHRAMDLAESVFLARAYHGRDPDAIAELEKKS